jgi:uncharacterized protein
VEAEVVYGCLMINDLIASAEQRSWDNKVYNDWAADFAKRSDPNRVFPLAIIPNTTHYSLIESPLLTEVATAFLTR